ncbi:response regulator [Tumidithrix helvetica PCC 7403]|uniref:response regulator n=1 Tax=Tumidithrix helvetica TaxID=3457545 RepID=UPI003CAAA36B
MNVTSPDRASILVVDDNPTNLGVLYDALTDAGYEVRVEIDGQNAIQQTQQNPPDLILLDVMMPEIDGFEVCRQLKTSPSTQTIPVIFMTALGDLKDKVTGLGLGAVDYITKPFQEEELLARVQLHMQLSHLSKTLAAQNLQLRSLTAELEQRVMERTGELSESLHELQVMQPLLEDANSQLKEYARTLAQKEEMLRLTIENAPIGILTVGFEGRFLSVNQAFCQMLGYDEDELLQKNLFEIAPPSERSENLAELESLRNREVSNIQIEKRYLRKDGKTIDAIVRSALVCNSDRLPLCLVLEVEDVTERKQIEETLRLQKRAIAASHNGVVIIDTRLPDLPTIYVNPAFERITGYSSAEILGRNCRFLQGSDRNQSGLNELRKALKERRDCTVSLRNYRKDGSLFWNELSISPIYDDLSNLTHYIGIQNDITERKHAEVRQLQLVEQLKQAKDEAESATRAKADFLAMMSHEIRTPMNGVLGMTQLLAETELTPEQSKFVRSTQVSGEVLLTVINDILDFSKIESGKLELENAAIDLKAAIANIYDLLLSKAQEKGLSFNYSVHPQVPPYIMGDVTRLRQILLNLISNALKFTEKGEIEVFVSLKENQLPDLDDSFHLLFSVRDTGIGMSTEQLQQLFQPFTQADLSTTRKYGGTGLGLAICQRLVSLMGGEISVESHFGQGSRFSFSITTKIAPANLVETVSQIPNTSLKPQGKLSDRLPLKILMAEDNSINQEIVMAMLKKLGYQADVVDNGVAAIAAVKARPYDLMLLDVQMPEMDGLEVANYLVTHWQTFNLTYPRPRMIAMTANAMQGDREKCLSAGMDDYISKPIMLNVLAQRISQCEQAIEPEDEKREDVDMAIASLEILDRSAIDGLGDVDLARELITLFIEKDAPTSLNDLKQAVQVNNCAGLKHHAHSFRGSSSSLGLQRLANLCLAIEDKAKANELQDLDDLVSQIEQQIELACQALRQLLKGLS